MPSNPINKLMHAMHRPVYEARLRELVRVSRRYVVASFFDRQSFHAWRKRHRGQRRPGRPGRTARSREQIEEAFGLAGARVVGYEHSLRFWSQQTFAIAERGEGGEEAVAGLDEPAAD